MKLSRDANQTLLDWTASVEQEICGVITEDDEVILIRNVAYVPQHYFQMDTEQQLRIWQDPAIKIKAIFHSHLFTCARPSFTDVWQAMEFDMFHVIIGIDGVRAYRLMKSTDETKQMVSEPIIVT